MKNPLSSDRRALLCVFAAACLAHVTALGGGYLWLDHAHLEEGLALAPPGGFLSLFQQGFAGTGFYRPLMALSLSIDAAISQTPLFFRSVTLAWHGAAAVMTTLLARRLGCSRNAAFFAGLLFGVHPVTSLVADAIAFRSEAMITVSLLALVMAHVSARPVLAAVALLFGALCKETALVLAPLLLVALEVFGPVPGPDRTQKQRWQLLGAEGIGLACALALRLAYAPSWRASSVGLTPLLQVGTRLAAFARSSAALLTPIDGTICDATIVSSLGSVPALVGLVALAGASYLAWQERVAGSLFLLSLLPGLSLVPVMRFWSPHYLYVPLAFGVIVAARLLERHHPRLLPAAALVASALGMLSLRQGARFTSDQALWTPEVQKRPSCLEGQFYLAEVARERADFAAAARRYEAALAPRSGVLSYVDRNSALQNLGAVSFRLSRYDDAERAWRLALESTTDAQQSRQLQVNLATLAWRQGRAPTVLDLLRTEVRRADALHEAIYLSATALHQLGREGEALALMQRVRGAPRAQRSVGGMQAQSP